MVSLLTGVAALYVLLVCFIALVLIRRSCFYLSSLPVLSLRRAWKGKQLCQPSGPGMMGDLLRDPGCHLDEKSGPHRSISVSVCVCVCGRACFCGCYFHLTWSEMTALGLFWLQNRSFEPSAMDSLREWSLQVIRWTKETNEHRLGSRSAADSGQKYYSEQIFIPLMTTPSLSPDCCPWLEKCSPWFVATLAWKSPRSFYPSKYF